MSNETETLVAAETVATETANENVQIAENDTVEKQLAKLIAARKAKAAKVSNNVAADGKKYAATKLLNVFSQDFFWDNFIESSELRYWVKAPDNTKVVLSKNVVVKPLFVDVFKQSIDTIGVSAKAHGIKTSECIVVVEQITANFTTERGNLMKKGSLVVRVMPQNAKLKVRNDISFELLDAAERVDHSKETGLN